MEQFIKVAGFILESLLHIWPYLLVSIPLAVLVQQSGASRFISKAIGKRPAVAVMLATIIGAFSPFCSCGVIPVITALLIGGVPLAPVMSFWIASPSMDPEIFFLSTATIGWELSVWRLAATFILSLSAGYTTLLMTRYGIIGETLRRSIKMPVEKSEKMVLQLSALTVKGNKSVPVSCCITDEKEQSNELTEKLEADSKCSCTEVRQHNKPRWKKLLKEIWTATFMVFKFMTLAFFINAIIEFYVPKEFIRDLLNSESTFSVVIATLIGIPAYTSNMTALPLISGLLSLGMNPGAALSFLVAGPVTTLPAMIAVWGIARPKIFLFYIAFSLIGALLTGLLFNLVH